METKKFLKFSVLNDEKKVSKKLKKINKTLSWKKIHRSFKLLLEENVCISKKKKKVSNIKVLGIP